MEQEIRFCTTSDGVRIAYATVGQGPPLVKAANWLNHLEFDWRSPVWRHWLEEMSKDHLFVRYDERGTGLSDWDVPDLSFEAWVADLESVVDALGLERFALLGWSQGGAVAIAYAVRHPERVSHLVLYGSFAKGWFGRDLPPEQIEELQALLTLTKIGWGRDEPTYRQIWTSMMMPEATAEQMRWFNDLARVSTSPENAIRLMTEFGQIDVVDLLPQVTAPTLVLHARHDAGVPFEWGREIAASIPGARFVSLESRNHFLLESDPAWKTFLTEVRRFLDIGERAETKSTTTEPSLVTILFTDMEGSTTLTQRLGDAAAQELLRTHNSIVREALKTHGGAEIKHTGDGIMASFPSASRALECTIAIQTALVERNETAEEPIKVRIGLNAGEPVAEDEDLFGTAVQLAARVCAHAQPGQVLASNVVRELSAGKGFLFSDQGDVVLRGFEDPVRLYEVRGG